MATPLHEFPDFRVGLTDPAAQCDFLCSLDDADIYFDNDDMVGYPYLIVLGSAYEWVSGYQDEIPDVEDLLGVPDGSLSNATSFIKAHRALTFFDTQPTPIV